MSELIRASRTAVLVWAGLMSATLVSWYLGTHEGHGHAVSAATIAVLVVTFVKVRFVGRHFMEVRDAPLVLRLILDAYVIVVAAGLIGIYASMG